MRAFYICIAIGLFSSVTACQGQENLEDHSCPTSQATSPVTYDNFGKDFFGTWCQSCHAADVTDRNGAPDDIFFDTRDDIWRLRGQVFSQTADSNTSMPIGPHGPSNADRKKLADWLACGAP
ncbi:MAG: hypothetical protein ABI461_16135 [Polyangiaceae bacterium]